MVEVMAHPWMTKGFNAIPDNYLPHRDALTLPLDPEVIAAMTGFNFGPPEVIKAQLTRIIESEDYQRNIRLLQKEKELPQPPKDLEKRRPFGFDFYKRRNSTTSRDALTTPSSEGLGLGTDPLNAFSPLISIYYLVREKQERDRIELQANAPPTKEKEPLPEIAPPQEAHTNASTYEMPGEKATGGRTRPRSRTHGEDEEAKEKKKTGPLSPTQPQETQVEPAKKESAAAGLLRRFSTRRRPKEPERLEKDRSHPPQVHVHSPAGSPVPPRKSFSIRRSRRERDDTSAPRLRSGSSQPQHSDLLSPPLSASGNTGFQKGLGRSTSVNSAEFRRRRAMGSGTRLTKDPPPTSGSDHSGTNEKGATDQAQGSSRAASARAKSLGHARRESIQARRLRREEERGREANVPEETDAEAGDHSGVSNERLTDFDLDKPVYLKGLFSVSTTSTKPVREIRTDIKRVLKQLGVDYTEIKGGFSCQHSPSIDLKKVVDTPTSPLQTPGHRRRFSFGLRPGDVGRDEAREGLERGPTTPRTPGARAHEYSASDVSEESASQAENGGAGKATAAGETRTNVRNDMGGNLVLEFEIFIVKVPVISLHGIQFKRMRGNTWQYKSMADQILHELRL